LCRILSNNFDISSEQSLNKRDWIYFSIDTKYLQRSLFDSEKEIAPIYDTQRPWQEFPWMMGLTAFKTFFPKCVIPSMDYVNEPQAVPPCEVYRVLITSTIL
jgi:hypothetical protein